MTRAALLAVYVLAAAAAVVAVIWLMVWAAGTEWAAPVGIVAVLLILSIDLLSRGGSRV